ncbi:H-NS histone family protein [Paraburkholderia sp. A3BS-1L]|uniref:H-NS histone family protein n=1 Tax=Paraburkholderia sp. A3BS-1L TaxID=3028375 RepID=UPI003DA875E8
MTTIHNESLEPTTYDESLAQIEQIRKQAEAQIEQIQKRANAQKEKEKADAIADMNTKIEKYGIAAGDLKWPTQQATGKKAKAKSKALPPKYKDPESGTTWSGHGKAPRWISGKDRSPFLIK